MRTRIIVLAGIILGLASPLASADELKSAATQVTECRSITDDTARLTCLDQASLALSLVLESAPRSAEAPETTVEDLDTPKWAQAPKPRKAPEPEAEEEEPKNRTPLWARVLRPDDGSDDDLFPITVVKITQNAAGRIFFYTDSGQVWRQTQVRKVTPPKSLPASAVVQRSATGNPKMSFDDVPNRSYRVRRAE